MARCGFKTNVLYRDEKTREYISEYVCPEPEENILDSGLCIFHSEQYLKDPKNKEANKLNIKRKLAEKIQKPEPLICIGYYLSDISFSGMHFDKSVNFSKTVFVGRSDFSEAQFTEANFDSAQFTEANFNSAQFTEANFRGAEFNVGLFITTQFNKIGDFRGAQFEIAVFNGAQFRRIANFETAHIKEANFSGAHFKEKANFSSINAHTDLEAPRLDFRDVQFDDLNKSLISEYRY